MLDKRSKLTGKGGGAKFFQLRIDIITHENFHSLSPKAIKLFVEFASQYNGFNNGDYCATWNMMEMRGWKSRDTLYKAIRELIDNGFVIVTRQGGKNKCSLYAFTFIAIDECGGKLDIRSTNTPPGGWR
jgi:hypothetical protein